MAIIDSASMRVGEAKRLRFDTGINLTGYSDLKIGYTAPNKSTGEWDDSNGVGFDSNNPTEVYIDIAGGFIDQSGEWLLDVSATESGKPYYSVPAILKVMKRREVNT